MSLNRKDIENVAHLARLALSEEEVPVYVTSLSRIIDTANVEPMSHPLPGQSQRLRPDVVTETDQHTLYQANAPQVQAGLYLVPRVIE